MKKQSIKQLKLSDLEGKKVLVRVDLNVPIDKSSGKITDDSRIVAVLPTINYLLDNKAKVILVSHLGRPKGQVIEELRLDPVAKHLESLLQESRGEFKVLKLNDSSGTEVKNFMVRWDSEPADGKKLCMLENIRFNPGEEKNDPDFARELSSIADIYVNDAFGTAHRAHASTVGVTSYLSPAVAGLLMSKEIEMLGGKLENPERPFTAIVGGAKVSSKISVLKNLVKKVDTLLIGGAMAYTFFKAQGGDIGNSLCEDEHLDTAREILALAEENNVAIILPDDSVCAQGDIFSQAKDADIPTKVEPSKHIEAGWMALDIGPKAAEKFATLVSQSRTIVWNGPLGVFEYNAFSAGTRKVAEALIARTSSSGTSIIGGGDSVAAIEQFEMQKASFTHVSTGGGASLEFLEGKDLPGVACLDADLAAKTA